MHDDRWIRGVIPRVPMTTPAIWPALRPLPPLGMGSGVLDDTVEYRSLFAELACVTDNALSVRARRRLVLTHAHGGLH